MAETTGSVDPPQLRRREDSEEEVMSLRSEMGRLKTYVSRFGKRG